MDLEISFELKKPAAEDGQNQPLQNQVVQPHTMTTSTVGHSQIKYINGSAKPSPAILANSELGQPKKTA